MDVVHIKILHRYSKPGGTCAANSFQLLVVSQFDLRRSNLSTGRQVFRIEKNLKEGHTRWRVLWHLSVGSVGGFESIR